MVDKTQLINRCPFCGKRQSVMVYTKDYKKWARGQLLAQEAFPYLTPNEREIIISGICSKCFPSEEE